jgi:hypothetical protein
LSNLVGDSYRRHSSFICSSGRLLRCRIIAALNCAKVIDWLEKRRPNKTITFPVVVIHGNGKADTTGLRMRRHSGQELLQYAHQRRCIVISEGNVAGIRATSPVMPQRWLKSVAGRLKLRPLSSI